MTAKEIMNWENMGKNIWKNTSNDKKTVQDKYRQLVNRNANGKEKRQKTL